VGTIGRSFLVIGEVNMPIIAWRLCFPWGPPRDYKRGTEEIKSVVEQEWSEFHAVIYCELLGPFYILVAPFMAS
jgi:hypothetical protein